MPNIKISVFQFHHILIFVEPACGKARHNCYNFCLVYVLVCICLGHNFYIYAWISKLFGTVVVLEEKKYSLKHFF